VKRKQPRLALVGVLSICVVVGLAFSGEAIAKKKSKGGPFASSTGIDQIVTPATTGPPFTPGILTSSVTAGKKFKGRQIADVNATVQWNVSGLGSDLDDLSVLLTAPNGATSFLVSQGLFGTALGPLTLDDETSRTLNGDDPADFQGQNFLSSPYIGSAEPSFVPLAVMDNGPVRGTWTLTVENFEDTATEVHTFQSWGLQVATKGKPLTK
jgi:hypothetical protein